MTRVSPSWTATNTGEDPSGVICTCMPSVSAQRIHQVKQSETSALQVAYKKRCCQSSYTSYSSDSE
uniref:Uncharacterized protein n=1 Tax=Oryza brachyantha TaxID=4533 RepID=J3M2F2_ORYBR